MTHEDYIYQWNQAYATNFGPDFSYAEYDKNTNHSNYSAEDDYGFDEQD